MKCVKCAYTYAASGVIRVIILVAGHVVIVGVYQVLCGNCAQCVLNSSAPEEIVCERRGTLSILCDKFYVSTCCDKLLLYADVHVCALYIVAEALQVSLSWLGSCFMFSRCVLFLVSDGVVLCEFVGVFRDCYPIVCE
jgi:hypothetical protein